MTLLVTLSFTSFLEVLMRNLFVAALVSLLIGAEVVLAADCDSTQKVIANQDSLYHLVGEAILSMRGIGLEESTVLEVGPQGLVQVSLDQSRKLLWGAKPLGIADYGDSTLVAFLSGATKRPAVRLFWVTNDPQLGAVVKVISDPTSSSSAARQGEVLYQAVGAFPIGQTSSAGAAVLPKKK